MTTATTTPTIMVPSRTRPGLVHTVTAAAGPDGFACACEWARYRRSDQHYCWHVAYADWLVHEFASDVEGTGWPDLLHVDYYLRQLARSPRWAVAHGLEIVEPGRVVRVRRVIWSALRCVRWCTHPQRSPVPRHDSVDPIGPHTTIVRPEVTVATLN